MAMCKGLGLRMWQQHPKEIDIWRHNVTLRWLNSFLSITEQIIKYSTCIKRGKVLSKSFPSRIIFQFFSFLMKKTQGGYQAIFIWSKINNLTTIRWFFNVQ
jgi:hypothetical protein